MEMMSCIKHKLQGYACDSITMPSMNASIHHAGHMLPQHA